MMAPRLDVDTARPWPVPPVAPACMTPAELGRWREVAAVVTRGTADPCADCTIAFAAAMRSQDRCNGFPGLTRHQSRLPETPERRRGRIAWFRQRCVSLGIDTEHAARVG